MSRVVVLQEALIQERLAWTHADRLSDRRRQDTDPVLLWSRGHPRAWLAERWPDHTLTVPWALRSPAQREADVTRLEALLATPGLDPEWYHLACLEQDRAAAWAAPPPGYPAVLGELAHEPYTVASLPLAPGPFVRQCGFWSQARWGREHWLVGLFNKVLPQPCRARVFPRMLKRLVGGFPDRQLLLRHIGLLGLLGHYEAVPPAHRLPVAWRHGLRLRAAMHPEDLDDFLLQTPALVVFLLRRLLLWCVQDHAPLAQHVGLMCPGATLDGVVGVTDAVLHEVRQLLQQSGERPRDGAQLWSDELRHTVQEHCRTAHLRRVLRHSYQRQRPALTTFLPTCRRYDGAGTPGGGPDGDDEDTGGGADPVPAAGEPVLAPETVAALYELVHRHDPVHTHVGPDLLPWLVHLGMPAPAVDTLQTTIRRYDHERLGKRELWKQLGKFRTRYPYSFRLVRTLCHYWNRYRQHRLYPLPHHYRLHQTEAVRAKFDLPLDTPHVPVERLCVVYCYVCGTVYSLLRSTARAARRPREDAHAVAARRAATAQALQVDPDAVDGAPRLHFRTRRARVLAVLHENRLPDPAAVHRTATASTRRATAEAYGYGTVSVDHRTGFMYCNRNEAHGPHRCPDAPLATLPLLGRVLQLGRRLVVLCPRTRCGIPFVYHHGCVYSPRGFLCPPCSVAWLREKRRRWSRWPTLKRTGAGRRSPASTAAAAEPTCAVGGCLLRNAARTYCYPHGLLLCRRHHHAYVAAQVRRVPLANAAEALQEILRARKVLDAQDHAWRVAKGRRIRAEQRRTESNHDLRRRFYYEAT